MYNCFLCEKKIDPKKDCINVGKPDTLFEDFFHFHTDCFEDEMGESFEELKKYATGGFPLGCLLFIKSKPDKNSIYVACGDNIGCFQVDATFADVLIGEEITSKIPQ
ncbi:MAG: hypothetical protein Q7K54_05805, partial [Candidatus Parcubacteria bacterium]|nr:hypothetical protein [Candidatus Parcubacteria bacterium]